MRPGASLAATIGLVILAGLAAALLAVAPRTAAWFTTGLTVGRLSIELVAPPSPTPEPDRCDLLPGAVWTTDASGNQRRDNTFDRPDDVYLDGGPVAPGQGGLPDGHYYYRVTAPNGEPLSEPREVEVVEGRLAHPVQLAPFEASRNRTYKAWLSPLDAFPQHCSKTDAFKIKGP